MAQIARPGEPGSRKTPEVHVRITIPEVFAGSAMAEVQGRAGQIVDLEVRNQMMVIHAILSESHVNTLEKTLSEWTQARSKVDRI